MFVATRSGLASARGLVGAAWDLPEIDQEYARFIEEFSGRERHDVLAGHAALAHAWRRFPATDPALPRDLLLSRWSGLTLARLFGDLHRRWSAGVQAECRASTAPDRQRGLTPGPRAHSAVHSACENMDVTKLSTPVS